MGAGASSPGLEKEDQSNNPTVVHAIGGHPLRFTQLHYHTKIAPHRKPAKMNNPREKKKRMTGLATLRKKLMKRKRSSRSFDHAKVLREFVSDWSGQELLALVNEYEAMGMVKEFAAQAQLARPPASGFKQDLAELYEKKQATDVNLLFQGQCFPVHRGILSVRCGYFRDLLSRYSGHNAQVPIDGRRLRVDASTFGALLRYLYTGELVRAPGTNLDMVLRLSGEFGTPCAVESDARYLLETGELADCLLVFQGHTSANTRVCRAMSASSSTYSAIDPSASDYGFHHRMELPCHKAVLAARSPFFRNLIARRSRLAEESLEGRSALVHHQSMRILLDPEVVPLRFAHVILTAIYLDTVDLGLILSDSSGGAGGGGVGGSQTPSPRPSPSCSPNPGAASLPLHPPSPQPLLQETMELYGIGRFLELDVLCQACEDLIVESLAPQTLLAILSWSQEAHGSKWVRRQALAYLREEFSQIAQTPVLLNLDKEVFAEALQSDFLQASELEVLQAVLRWGEHQLVKRMEDREPNLVSQTAHSVAKKGVKKKDLNDVELREITSELLPLVRMDHVIPPTHEVLTNAIKRGLVSKPPSHMIGDDLVPNFKVNAWVRGKNNGLFVKPRLFLPYWEEARALLDEVLPRQDLERMHIRMPPMPGNIPDTLYMLEGSQPPRPLPVNHSVASSEMSSLPPLETLAQYIPVPKPETLEAMLKRDSELRRAPATTRAYNLPLISRREINRQIRLRVVREFNLPDSVAEVLEAAVYYGCEGGNEDAEMRESGSGGGVPMQMQVPHSPRHSSAMASPLSTVSSPAQLGLGSMPSRHPLSHYSTSSLMTPSIIPETDPYCTLEGDASSCSEGHLSDTMPDIALATSSLRSLHVEEHELDLDLGLGDRRPPPPSSSSVTPSHYRHLFF
ncbi:unnamed protein product [Darwinula stevensoni]|uniref:BTB domain-containing protein n=1 Tax=Darwinula stevensoni TaxID=69355 RepID=A0A7R9AAC1_9CRUS|nr:unnamed protein product [Darwinula stevensoni]CAG0897944.1 unnamed protein product [Darwinula stevensoni]